jgi:hypothetical protein
MFRTDAYRQPSVLSPRDLFEAPLALRESLRHGEITHREFRRAMRWLRQQGRRAARRN